MVAPEERGGQPDGSSPLYDLGVLFVHGIGQQRRGETLAAWADPLIRWFASWLGRSSIAVATADLTPSPDDPAAPARLTLAVDCPGEPDVSRWLVAESWWAEAFALPRFRELAVWGFAVLPWTVVAHFAARLQQAWRGAPVAAGRPGGATGPVGVVLRAVRVAWQALGLLLAVTLFPFLAVGVLAVVVLGAVPIPQVRQVAVALQRVLSTSVGDSFVLVSSPTRARAIVSRVERDYRWLADRCRQVAVVAHSQGAAIAHRAVRGVPADSRRLATFVTVGSGQTKLADLERVRDSTVAREVWYGPAGLLVLVAGIWYVLDSIGSARVTLDDDWWQGPVYMALVGIGLLTVGIFAAWPRRRPAAGDVDVGAAHGWLDLYATHDPVPNGPLFHQPLVDGDLPVTSRPVHNLASPRRDHTWYLQNTDEFVPTLATALARAAGLSVDAPGSWGAAHRLAAAARRRWRVGCLQALRLLAVATGVVLLAVHAPRWAALGSEVAGVVAWVVALVPVIGGDAGTVPPRAAGVVAIAVATWAGYAIAAGVWRVWDARESRRSARREDVRPLPGELAAVLVVTGTLLGVVALWSAGVVFRVTSDLLGLPLFVIVPILVGSVVWQLLRWPLLGLERLGYAERVDRQASGNGVLIVLLVWAPLLLLMDIDAFGAGVTIAVLVVYLALPLLPMLLPPLLDASGTYRALAQRLRVWVRAEPAPLVAARLGGVGDDALAGYGRDLVRGAQTGHDDAGARAETRDVVLVVARRLEDTGRPDLAAGVLGAAAPLWVEAALALAELDPADPDAVAALSAHAARGVWRDRRRARRALAATYAGQPRVTGGRPA